MRLCTTFTCSRLHHDLDSVPVHRKKCPIVVAACDTFKQLQMAKRTAMCFCHRENNYSKHAWETGKPKKNVVISANLGIQKSTLKWICATFSPVTPPPPPPPISAQYWLLKTECQMPIYKCSLFQLLSYQFWIIMSFYADLPIDLPGFEIFSALWRFEGCLDVLGWIIGKRKMKAVSSQPDLF